jgi:hypothetical protein
MTDEKKIGTDLSMILCIYETDTFSKFVFVNVSIPKLVINSVIMM